jgi:hypothetical protein
MRHKVLIILHADGYIEAFADREQVDVLTVVMPHVPGGEILAEEYLELTLTKPYRDIYYPLNRRAVDNVRTILPSQIMRQQVAREFLLDLRNIRADADKEHARTGYDFGLSFDD